MSTPLSSAFKGASYKNTSGTAFGDIGSVLGGLIGDAQAQREAKRKQALEQALADRQVQELKLQGDKFEYERGQDKSKMQFDRDKLTQDTAHDNLALEGLNADRAARNEDRDRDAGMRADNAAMVDARLRTFEAGRDSDRDDSRAITRAFRGFYPYEKEDGSLVFVRRPGMQPAAAAASGNKPGAAPDVSATSPQAQAADPTQPGPKEAAVHPGATNSQPQQPQGDPNIVETGIHGSKANAPIGMGNAYRENEASMAKIDRAIKEAEAHPNSFGLARALPDFVNTRIDAEGVGPRSSVSDLTSLILHDRSGANVTKVEIPRQRGWMPDKMDETPTVIEKLRKMKERFQLANENIRQGYPDDTNLQPLNPLQVPQSGAGDPIARYKQLRAENPAMTHEEAKTQVKSEMGQGNAR